MELVCIKLVKKSTAMKGIQTFASPSVVIQEMWCGQQRASYTCLKNVCEVRGSAYFMLIIFI